MRMWEISPRVNSPKNDDSSLWNPFMHKHRRQPMCLNSCASRQVLRLSDILKAEQEATVAPASIQEEAGV